MSNCTNIIKDNPSNCGDFPSLLSETMKTFSVYVRQGEELIWLETLQKHLNRLVVSADFEDCQMKFEAGKLNSYVLAYKGEDLGIVRKELKMNDPDPQRAEYGHKMEYVITFQPFA